MSDMSEDDPRIPQDEFGWWLHELDQEANRAAMGMARSICLRTQGRNVGGGTSKRA
jgi:hypothetical protein